MSECILFIEIIYSTNTTLDTNAMDQTCKSCISDIKVIIQSLSPIYQSKHMKTREMESGESFITNVLANWNENYNRDECMNKFVN